MRKNNDSSTAKHLNEEFILIPNPANDKVEIKLNSEEPINEIKILSSIGNLIEKKRIENNKPYTVNIHNYPTGIYFISVSSEGKYFGTKKLTVIH